MEPGFFIKLTEIPNLASLLEDEGFNQQLRENPASVFEEHNIAIPRELIPETVSLPSPQRIRDLKAALAILQPGEDGEEINWYPWIGMGMFIPWYPFSWFPFFRSGGSA